MEKSKDLLTVNDVFENDELIITKAVFKENDNVIISTDVGIKDNFGDIVEFKNIKEEIL